MNRKGPPTELDGWLPRRIDLDALSLDPRTAIDRQQAGESRHWPAQPGLKPDEQALHDALLWLAHPEEEGRVRRAPAEIFLG